MPHPGCNHGNEITILPCNPVPLRRYRNYKRKLLSAGDNTQGIVFSNIFHIHPLLFGGPKRRGPPFFCTYPKHLPGI